jgi:hypothetical protein
MNAINNEPRKTATADSEAKERNEYADAIAISDARYDLIQKHERELARLRADNARLREALKAAADALNDEQMAAMGDEHPVLKSHALVLKKARAALGAK